MSTRRFVYTLALPVGMLLAGLNGAGAQESAREACTPDAMRLCNEFIPDEERVKACMLRKRAQLSEACRLAMRGGRVERSDRVARRRQYYRQRYQYEN
jgi:hypothetical protein